MAEYREFSEKTVSDCITEACMTFSVTSDRLDYEVVSEGSSGLFGIGSKPAVIRARVKEESFEQLEAAQKKLPRRKRKKKKQQKRLLRSRHRRRKMQNVLLRSVRRTVCLLQKKKRAKEKTAVKEMIVLTVLAEISVIPADLTRTIMISVNPMMRFLLR